MPSLNGAIQKAINSNFNSRSLTNLVFGNVVQIDPDIRIKIEGDQEPLPTAALEFTDAVLEKKMIVHRHKHDITSLRHTHITDDATSPSTSRLQETFDALNGTYPTEYELQNIEYYINGDQVEKININTDVETLATQIVINRALEVGDKVMMLSVKNGQGFIVLCKITEEYKRTLDPR